MKIASQKKSSLLLVFSVVFLDLLGFGIALPIIAPLLIDGTILSGVSHDLRNIILGLLLASYALAQFFGAPILGSLSDKYGRKPILLITIFGNGLGYVLFAVGIITANIWLLFASRILAGFAGGNIAVAQSIIADISTPAEKTKNFGMIGMAFGLGFILGPFVGGLTSNSALVSWFSYATPFFLAAVLSVVNLVYVWFRFHETLHTKVSVKVSLLTGFHNLGKAYRLVNVRMMFIVVFLFTLGFSFYTQFFQVYLIERFSYTPSDIGNVFGFMGLCVALTQGIITRFVSKKLSSRQVLSFSYIGSAVCIFAMIFQDNVFGLYTCIGIMAIFNGLTMANMTSVISNLAGKESQGEMMGISQSLQALGMTIPPIIAGIIVSFWVALPIVMSSILVLSAGIVFVIMFHLSRTKFRDVS